MKPVLHWMKNNPVIVVSVALCLVSIGVLVYVHIQGDQFRATMIARGKEINLLKGLEQTSVVLPPETTDGLPRETAIAINRAAIEDLSHLYARMNDEYTNIFKFAMQVNRGLHQPMLDGLFPVPANDSLYFEARGAYARAFSQFFGEYRNSAEPYRLDAGMPPGKAEIDAEMKRLEDTFNGGMVGAEDVQGVLHQSKAKRMSDLLMRQAQQIHIYADRDPSSPDFPFDVGAWSREGNKPAIEEIWEGQMSLWIQQDIVQAIAQTNRVDDPKWDVMHAPIKRLLSINVVPGYVGINTQGGLGTGPGRTGTGVETVATPEPAGSADVKLPDNFALAPTGRRSNALYDVRHAWVSVVADVQKLPEFFDQLARVNFMTVLKVEITDVDEYDALKQGFVYGSGDVARVDMLVESIWLRRWTAGHKDEAEAKQLNETFDRGLMPDAVRTVLGLEPRIKPAVAAPAPASE